MPRFILTGAPGCGKTTLLRAMGARGYSIVNEAATAVIAKAQAQGDDEPWTRRGFIDEILKVQQHQEVYSPHLLRGPQIFDRSPVCTLALNTYLGYPASAHLSAEIKRITREQVYAHRVFFVANLGFIRPTPARKITFQASLKFQQVHADTYRRLGYELIDVPRASVADRVSLIEAYITWWTQTA